MTVIQESDQDINNDVLLNQEVFKLINITSQEQMILSSLEKFFENENTPELFLSFVANENNVSIRLIDYYVTKYSKNHKISYKLVENGIETTFNVFNSYRQQLKAFQKKHFDPFSRGDRIPYFLNDICIITTIGQLNFFKCFIYKNIYEYIKNNHVLIENDMNKKKKIEKIIKKKEIKSKKIIKNSFLSIPNTSSNYISINSNEMFFSEVKKDKIIVSFSFN